MAVCAESVLVECEGEQGGQGQPTYGPKAKCSPIETKAKKDATVALRLKTPTQITEVDTKKLESFPGKDATFRVFEVGCGAGNGVFPILRELQSYSKSFLYCCDFSSEAVSLVKLHPFYNAASSYAFVHDVCDEALTFPFPDESINIILLVFVLSPIHPDRMQWVVHRLAKLLKPGGMLLFRDYGRYNLSQLRFKKGRCLFENWYVRGGGTRVYFFTKDEMHNIVTSVGLNEIQNLLDQRLQVNRRKGVTMQRVWLQSKYQKPLLCVLTKKNSNYSIRI
ncbi:mRNA N(3)-methylcytidine methyltransferase METTL8 [Latimeria chalumnae]|uniref:mRNA N(3)-methylcytidine methyltransferase METTL8 n=1 Tax=Latimeria chalumnae TaxID=7897 RepID=UPI00313D87BE